MARNYIGLVPGDPGVIKELVFPFITTAAAMDANFPLIEPDEKKIAIVDAKVVFQQLDTFASGVDIDLEVDDGSTETEIANYDTVSGTATNTWYTFTFTDSRIVTVDEWLQLRVDDDEDAACQGVVVIHYMELDAEA